LLPRTRARRASRRERVHPQVASSADPVLLVFLQQRAYRPAPKSACSPSSRIRAGRSSCEPTTSCTHAVVSRILSGRVGEGLVYCLVGQDGEDVAFRQWRRHSCYRPRWSGHGQRTEGPRHRQRYRHSPSIVGARGSVRNPYPPRQRLGGGGRTRSRPPNKPGQISRCVHSLKTWMQSPQKHKRPETTEVVPRHRVTRVEPAGLEPATPCLQIDFEQGRITARTRLTYW